MNNILDWKSSERLLSSWSLPFISTISASGPDEAAKAAQAIGFPVAVKAISPLMTHKATTAWSISIWPGRCGS